MDSAQHELRLSLIAGERCYVQEHTVVVQTTVDVEGKEPLTQIAVQPTVARAYNVPPKVRWRRK